MRVQPLLAHNRQPSGLITSPSPYIAPRHSPCTIRGHQTCLFPDGASLFPVNTCVLHHSLPCLCVHPDTKWQDREPWSTSLSSTLAPGVTGVIVGQLLHRVLSPRICRAQVTHSPNICIFCSKEGPCTCMPYLTSSRTSF